MENQGQGSGNNNNNKEEKNLTDPNQFKSITDWWQRIFSSRLGVKRIMNILNILHQ